MRSPEALSKAISSLGVETNEIYQPGHLVPGTTWCNRFATDVTAMLGCPIPFLKANQQLEWLSGLNGAAQGWSEIQDHGLAPGMAAAGVPVVAVWSNPRGHGHIAVCVPSPVPGKLFIAQAGSKNFSLGPISSGFGSFPYRLFTHE